MVKYTDYNLNKIDNVIRYLLNNKIIPEDMAFSSKYISNIMYIVNRITLKTYHHEMFFDTMIRKNDHIYMGNVWRCITSLKFEADNNVDYSYLSRNDTNTLMIVGHIIDIINPYYNKIFTNMCSSYSEIERQSIGDEIIFLDILNEIIINDPNLTQQIYENILFFNSIFKKDK